MNPNDCQDCVWKQTKEGFCQWWYTEPDCICDWFCTNGRRV